MLLQLRCNRKHGKVNRLECLNPRVLEPQSA